MKERREAIDVDDDNLAPANFIKSEGRIHKRFVGLINAVFLHCGGTIHCWQLNNPLLVLLSGP